MAFLLLIAFIATPIIEIAVFIEVGGRIGLWSTIGIVILTAVIGTAMLRQQGISVLFRIQENLNANRMPLRELFDGVCLVAAGALLLTPGFVTDAIGFLLFIPPLRQTIATYLGKHMLARAEVHIRTQEMRNDGQNPAGPDGTVIDGEFEDVTPEQPDQDRTQLPKHDDEPKP
tara:strand:- start:13993 stop:14511 length:519 start_codon:yes stop_codon:yes gene_type:complete